MGPLFALITGLSWGAYNLAVRQGMQVMGSGPGYVVTLAFGAVANALLLLLPLPGRGSPGFGWIPLGWFILAGFSTTLMGRWFYFKSVALLGPSRASSWKNSSPIYTMVLGFLLLGERPTWLGVAGTASVMGGLLLLSREQSRSMKLKLTAAEMRKAILLGVASALGFATGMLLRKAGLNHWADATAGSAIGVAVAFLAYVPFAAARGEVAEVFKAPRAGITAFVVAGLFSTLAQLFTFLSLRVSAAATTHVIASLEPIFTMMLSAVFLRRQEGLTASLAGSAALVCFGVVLMTR